MRDRSGFDRFTFAADVGDGGARNPHPDIVGNFKFQFIIVGYFDNLTDQATAHHDLIAPTDIFDHFLMFLLALLLRPDHLEIHNDKNENKRNDLDQHIRTPKGGCTLRIGGRNHVRNLRSNLKHGNSLKEKSSRIVGRDYSQTAADCKSKRFKPVNLTLMDAVSFRR